jgi:RNA polymerase sigma-70 factor (ECF subfamily)
MKPEEFIRAFEEYNENIYRFVFFKLNQNRQVAEDVTQNVFMKAWEKRDSYDATKSSLRTWLYLISKRLVVDEYRKKSMPVIGNEVEQLQEGNNKLEDEYMLSFVTKRINNLKEQDKEIIILRYIEGIELDEISLIINKSYDATKVACNRAMKKLQEQVENNNYKLKIKN